MTDYDFGPPATAPDFIDPIYGLRAFNLDKMGRLRPWMNTEYHIWTPGENVAMHVGWMFSPLSFLDVMVGEGKGEEPPPHSPHTCASCGFYAYTDEQSAEENHVRKWQIAGIIEAYGKVSQGPLGFRAEKAKVVAVHVPGPPIWVRRMLARLRPWMLVVASLLLLAVAIAVDTSLAPDNTWLRRAFSLPGGMLIGLALSWRMFRGGRAIGGPNMRARIALRDNYPDVKFYRRRKAMMKDYGIRQYPDLPNRDQNEFWTVRRSDS